MADIFKDVLGIEGVHGVLFLTEEGVLSVSQFTTDYQSDEEKIKGVDWSSMVGELSGIAEAEIMFDEGRFYIRKTNSGYLMVILEDHAPVSMVRLNCEVLLPVLDKQKAGKGISQLLRKKIF
ncbi:MAG: hypothetical protein KGY61_11200 [Desulfobacterales bacterium]|nr:hypothetical protein [Desulfobacterales bacterium]